MEVAQYDIHSLLGVSFFVGRLLGQTKHSSERSRSTGGELGCSSPIRVGDAANAVEPRAYGNHTA